MSYPRYQEYIKSGVEWLGETPSTWTIKRVGYFFNERREKVSDKDFQPLSVTKNGIVPQLDSAAKSDDGDNRKKVCIGDFVINSRSDRKGSSGASALDGSVSLINTVIVPNENIDIKFAHNLFRSTAFQEEYYRYGKGIVADLWSTNYSEMKNISIPIPSLKEQRIIADFLENETSKIDYLVAELEKLIELLKEKRQAVISHAVTKGLIPENKMKDSGVERLGKVPENWDIKPIQWIASINDEVLPESTDVDYEIQYVDIGGVNLSSGVESSELHKFKDAPSRARRIVKHGDVIVSTVRTYLRAIAFVKEPPLNMIVSTGFAVIRSRSGLESNFAQFALQSTNFIDEVISRSTGISYPAINASELAKIKIPLPPIEEQITISSYLNNQTFEIDSLISESTKIIALLQERRSALITAAVTGQIDVRNYQAKEIA
jgi:type I restriction enzyme S subunit